MGISTGGVYADRDGNADGGGGAVGEDCVTTSLEKASQGRVLHSRLGRLGRHWLRLTRKTGGGVYLQHNLGNVAVSR